MGPGFTTTVAVNVVPVQLFAEGVNVKVTVTGAFVVLVRLPVILPVPLEAIPVTAAVLSRVQLNVVPGTFPLSMIVVIELPEHIVCVAGVAVPLGSGLTVIVAEPFMDAVQPEPFVAIIVYVPAVVWVTKAIGIPVPAVGVPVLVLFTCN